MSGLASRWATESSLVNEAESQDKKIQDTEADNQRTNPSKIPSSKSPKKLESKWANFSEDETKKKSNKGERGDRGERGNRKHNEFNKTSNKHYKHTQGPRNRSDKNTNLDKKENRKSFEVQEDDFKEMSEAGKSFAARLGMGNFLNNSTSPHKRNPSTSRTSTRKASLTNYEDNSDNEFETTDQGSNDNKESQEKLPEMGAAGRSLAARLGQVSLDEQPSSSNSSENAAPKKQYLTPKQRRELKNKEEQSKQQQLEEEKKAKAKAELDQLMAEMADSNSSWADIE